MQSSSIEEFPSLLNEEETSQALFIHGTITVKKGNRKGELYKTSKKEWRDQTDKKMASIYYVWRTLSFRLGQDIQLPLHSKRYIEPTSDGETVERLNKIVEYIGLRFFQSTYVKYKGCNNVETT